MSKFRIEKDSLGSVEVPSDVYYGVQSKRAQENFKITGIKVSQMMIESMAYVKKACALANIDLDDKIQNAMVQAAEEVIEGKFNDDFVTDAIQGGAGTSMNMNMNEVIANRAEELLGGNLGEYNIVHPNDHVNKGQSTNDIIPTSGKITTIKLTEALIKEMSLLAKAFRDKAKTYKNVIKVGRTHLQDAVFVSMGQILNAYASVIERDVKRIQASAQEMKDINLGATAIGTEINAVEGYRDRAVKHLSELLGYEFTSNEDLVDGTRHIDGFAQVSSSLKVFALSLSRISNDIRLMASGPRAGYAELILPEKQPGSSIMPGKVNPVIIEVTNQACFQVIGNDTTVSLAVEAGQMELNVFEPVLFYNLFESFEVLTRAVANLRINAIEGLKVNEAACKESVENSLAGATALIRYFGYAKVSTIANEALANGKSLREVVLAHGLLDSSTLDKVLDPSTMIGRN